MGGNLWPASATVPIGGKFAEVETGRLVEVSAASCVEDDIEVVDLSSGQRDHVALSQFQSAFERRG